MRLSVCSNKQPKKVKQFPIPGIILAIPALLILSGCLHHENKDATESNIVSTPAAFSKNGRLDIQSPWWKSFEDKQLDALIDEAFRDNPGIGQAWARLRQAEATLQTSKAGMYPDLNLNASARRQYAESQTSDAITETTSGSAGLSSSYELDLWGRVRAQHKAAYFETMATEQDLNSAAITIAAQVVNTWFSLLEKTGQKRLLTAQYDNAKNTLKLLKIRFQKGSIIATDLLQQEQAVESRRASLLLNQGEIEVLEHALATLIGKDPTEATFTPETELPSLPEFPLLGMPVTVIHQRPDVQSAWLRIQAADASVAASIANRFPKITLGGSITSAFGSPVQLFEQWIESLTSSLNVPIFDAGTKKADTKRKKAQLASAILDYHSSVLNAIKEVENAIIQEQQQLSYIESLETQAALAEQVHQQTLNRFKRGNRTYLQVLVSQNSLHNLNRSHLSAKRTLLNYRVNLYRATGGLLELPQSNIFNKYTNFRL